MAAPTSSISPQAIGPELQEVILKALANRPEDRFPSARAFAEALTQAMRPRPRWESTEPLRPRSEAELSPYAEQHKVPKSRAEQRRSHSRRADQRTREERLRRRTTPQSRRRAR